MLVVLKKTNDDGDQRKHKDLGLDVIAYCNISLHIQYFSQYQK